MERRKVLCDRCTRPSTAEAACKGCEEFHAFCDHCGPAGYYIRGFEDGWMWPCCPDAFEINEVLRGE